MIRLILMLSFMQGCISYADEYKDLNVYGKAKFHTKQAYKSTKRGFIKASDSTWKFFKKITPRITWRKDEKDIVDQVRDSRNTTLYKEDKK